MVRITRFRTIILSPIGFFLFAVGWGLCWTGSRKTTKIIKNKPVAKVQGNLKFAMLPPEMIKMPA